VDVQVDEVGAHGGAIVRGGPDSLPWGGFAAGASAEGGRDTSGILRDRDPLGGSRSARQAQGTPVTPAQEGGSRRYEGELRGKTRPRGSSRERDPPPRIPIVRLQEPQVPAAEHGAALQPAAVVPAGGLEGRLGGGSLAQTRDEPLHEPFLLAACVERREMWVEPAIGHGCTRSPRERSSSSRRRPSAGTTSRTRSSRCSPSASGRARRRRRGAAPSRRSRSGR
jgi:hypothetical protein